MKKLEILDPTTEAKAQALTFAPRPSTLEGKRVGLIENTKFNSDRLLQKIGKILEVEYAAAGSVMWRKRNASVPAHAEILDDAARQVDVVVAGIGD